MARASFLHAADIHLSRPFGFLPLKLAEERRLDQRKALTRIVDLALERDVDMVLMAGDVFDRHDPDPTDLEAVTKEFSRLREAGKRVFVIPGNHDYVAQGSFWHDINGEAAHVFLDTEWSSVPLDDMGVTVAGAAFSRDGSERRAFESLQTDSGTATVVLAHASYEAFEGQIERYHPFSSAELTRTGASYVALGHYHRFNPLLANGVAACYAGSPEGLSFDSPETGDRFVVVGEISEDGKAKIEPVKINRRAMSSVEIDLTPMESPTSLFNGVRKLCDSNTHLQLRLTGNPTSEVAAALSQLGDRFRESCMYVTVDSSAVSFSADVPADDLTIRGRFCRYLREQMQASDDPQRRRLLRRAMELGLAAFDED